MDLEEIKEFCKGLKDNHSIKILWLGNNQLGLNIENFKEFCKGLKENKSIKEIGPDLGIVGYKYGKGIRANNGSIFTSTNH